MYNLKLDLTNLKPSNLISKCRTIEQSMEGNAYFQNPSPPLADIEAQRMELVYLIWKAKNGDKEFILKREVSHKKLTALLKKLANYINFTADGNEEIILSSSFELRKKPEPILHLSPPMDLNLSRTLYGGRVKLDWSRVKGSQVYGVEMTEEDPEDMSKWKNIGMCTKSKLDVNNLTFGNLYYFRVKAVGANTESAYSEVHFIRAV